MNSLLRSAGVKTPPRHPDCVLCDKKLRSEVVAAVKQVGPKMTTTLATTVAEAALKTVFRWQQKRKERS